MLACSKLPTTSDNLLANLFANQLRTEIERKTVAKLSSREAQ